MGELRRANVILYKTVRAFKQPSEDGLVCVMLNIVGVHKTKVVGTKIGLKLLQDLSRLLYWQYSPPASTVPQMHQMWLVRQHVFQPKPKRKLITSKKLPPNRQSGKESDRLSGNTLRILPPQWVWALSPVSPVPFLSIKSHCYIGMRWRIQDMFHLQISWIWQIKIDQALTPHTV